MEDKQRRLLRHGSFQFLLGLLTGLVIPQFTNPRAGLASHLEGVMNGTFLLALGAAWHHLRLSRRDGAAAWWTLLYGTYGNWLFTTASAVFGTAAMMPIAAGHHAGAPWQEALITAGLASVAVSMIVAIALVLYGLRR